jgi:hypothetical protein
MTPEEMKQKLEHGQDGLFAAACFELVFGSSITAGEALLMSLYLEKISVLLLQLLKKQEAAEYIAAHYSKLTLFSHSVTPVLKGEKIKSWTEQPAVKPVEQALPVVEPGVFQRVRRAVMG